MKWNLIAISIDRGAALEYILTDTLCLTASWSRVHLPIEADLRNRPEHLC